MGFPDHFKIPVSDTQAYKQFGNSVVVPVVEKIAANVVNALTRGSDYQPEMVLCADKKTAYAFGGIRNRNGKNRKKENSK